MSNNSKTLDSLFSSNDEQLTQDLTELLSLLLKGNPNENVKTAASIIFE